MRFILGFALLAACNKDKESTEDSVDTTGTDGTTVGTDSAGDTATDTDTDTAPPCETTVLSVTPEAGESAAYYRDPVIVSFTGDGSAATIQILDGAGAEVAATAAWSDGNVQVTLTTVLAPSSPYTVHVDVCSVTTDTAFSTSSLGSPLTVAPEDLLGNTYEFRLSNDAEITEPAFLDVMAASYLNVPLLFGVSAVDATSLTLIGSLGTQADDGSYSQDVGDVWHFPACDFSTAPFFSTVADLITLTYNGTDIPIEQFTLEGTFAPDGSSIEHGVATGNVDSRNLGPLVGQPDEPGAICNLASDLGVKCVPCADGEPYCLYMVAEQISAEMAEGLTLVDDAG